MTDPYKVLEVSPTATDDEVKEAYRKMAKKYHPDKYAGSPLADVATEKMKEVNEAYDEILRQRKEARSGGNANGYNPNAYTYQNNGYHQNGYSSFNDVRNLINNGRIDDAEQILNGVPQNNRNAEWYFLKGTVLFRRGWTDEAYKHFSAATQMDPNNLEYRMAFNNMNRQRNGNYGGYQPGMQTGGGCNACNVCSGLLCADCCCEACGGDICRCV